jgi:hypothetical protein
MYFFMPIRKKLIISGLVIFAAAAPVTINTSSVVPRVSEHAVFAQKGSGKGNSGNNNGRSDNGRDGRSNDGKGNDNQKGDEKTSSPKHSPSKTPARADAVREPVEIRHDNGITETLRRGRYIMKDAKGRTIVNRRATSADIRRLERYAHH